MNNQKLKIRRKSTLSRGEEFNNQPNTQEQINDTYYKMNMTKGESLYVTKDYSTDSKQMQFIREGLQEASRQEDDSKINIFDIDRQEIDNTIMYKKLGGQKQTNDRKNKPQMNIQIPVGEDPNEDGQKYQDIKNKALPMLSPNSSHISLLNRKNILPSLENQLLSPVGSSTRMYQEDKVFSPSPSVNNSYRSKGNGQQQGGNTKNINQVHSQQFITSKKILRQQMSLQTRQSLPSASVIPNTTMENINANGINNNANVDNNILSSISNNLLKSTNLRQKRHQNASIYPLNKSGSNETTPIGSLVRQNSLVKTQQYFNTMTNYNFTNALNDSLNNININSNHSVIHKFGNSSGMNTPMANTNNSQQNNQGAKLSQMIRNSQGFFIRSKWFEALKIIFVERFKKRMLSLISHRFKHSLTPSQIQLLDDKSNFLEEKSRFHNFQSTLSSCCTLKVFKLPFSNILQGISQFLQNVEAIQPNSTFLLLWKLFFIIVSFFSIYYFSLKAAFDVEVAQLVDNQIIISIFYLVFNLIFALDFFIDLNTGFYQEGVVQHSRVKIIKKSLHFDLWIHVLKIILLFFQFSSILSSPQAYVLCFLHIYSMSKDFQPLDQHQQIQQKWPIFRLVALLFIVVLTVAHLSGCFFYSISLLPNNSYSITNFRNDNTDGCNNWVSCQSLEDQDWKVKYIFSLYFSYITMVTVGYGDIFPVSVYEKIYVIIMTCASCGIFGYAINKIGSVINENAQKQLAQKQEQYEIINYMHNRQISKSTQIKVLKFIEHVQEKEKENPINGQLILKKVSKNLKQQVHVEYFGNILKQSKLFKLTFSQAFLDELITYMNEVLFSPDEVIFNSNKSTENILYFLVDGTVGVYSNYNSSENKLIEVISSIYHILYQKKRFVGLTSFFSEQQEENLVLKTHETSLIVSLLHKDFIKCINNFPTDLEKYHNIKQNVIDSTKRLEQCSSCGEFTHTVQKCHLLHLSLNTQLIKSKYQFSQSQLLRDSTKKRKKKIKINTLKINKNVRKKVRMIRSNLILESRGHQQLDGSIETEELEFETDHHFLKRVAQIKYSQNQLQTLSDLNVTGEDSNNSTLTSDSDENNSNDSRYNFNHIKSNSYNQIQEMEEEYGVEETEEINNQKRKNYYSKKHQSYQSENSYPKRLSNLLSPSNNTYQKKTKRSYQGSDNESNENIQSRYDLTRSTGNIDQENTLQISNHSNEYQPPQRNKNDKISKEKKSKKRKSNEKSNNQNNKEIPYKSNSLPKNNQVEMLKAQPLKSNSLPKHQPQKNLDREQPLKSYSLPRDTNSDSNYPDYVIKRKPQRFSVEEQFKKKQTNDNSSENDKDDLNSSIFKSGNESSFHSNHQNNQKSSENINIQNQQVPKLKISYAPPLHTNNLMNNQVQEAPASSRNHSGQADIKVNYLPTKEKKQQSTEDLFASIIIPDNISQINREQKINQSNLIADQIKYQGFFNAENGNNQSVRNQTDFPTTLPTYQDDYNYTDQFFINLNNNPTQFSEYLDPPQTRQKINPHTLNVISKNENQQNFKTQNSEKKSENNFFEDKTTSGGLTNDNNFLKTPESYIIPSLNVDNKVQLQKSEAQIQDLSKSSEFKSASHNLSIPQSNKYQQLTKVRTFDEKTDKLRKKVTV